MAEGDETKSEKKGGFLVQIFTAVAIALFAGGTSPWWVKAFSKPDPQPAPITPVQQNAGAQTVPQVQPQTQPQVQPTVVLPAKEKPEAADTASRAFFVGQWHAETFNSYGVKTEGTANYQADGRYQGTFTQGVGYMGQRQDVNGYWNFEKISDKEFRVIFRPDGGMPTNAIWKILDHDHIQNEDMNYVADRVE